MSSNRARSRIGAPSKYTERLADSICERLADGESLKAICAGKGMPSRTTVFRWLADNPAFRDMYTRAREEQADALADEIVSIADEAEAVVKHDGEDVSLSLDATAVARNRLRVDARKWVAAKLKPRKYGDKVAIGGAEDLPPVQHSIDASRLSDATLQELLSVRRAATDGG